MKRCPKDKNVGKMVRKIVANDNIKAHQMLEQIIRDKIAKKISDAIDDE